MGQWDSGVGHCIAWSMDILWIWWPWYFHPGNSKEWSGIRRDIKSNWGVSRVVVTRKVMLCWFIVITTQRLVSHLQENNVCIFLAQWRMFLVHLHLYLYSGSKLVANDGLQCWKVFVATAQLVIATALRARIGLEGWDCIKGNNFLLTNVKL